MEITGFKVAELRIGGRSIIIEGGEVLKEMTQRVAIEGMERV